MDPGPGAIRRDSNAGTDRGPKSGLASGSITLKRTGLFGFSRRYLPVLFNYAR